MQDLHMQRRALEKGGVRELESGIFEMSVEQALATLEQKITELEGGLGAAVRERYRRLIRTGQRVVVPVLAGTCYGCFVAVPTSWAAGADPNEKLNVCQSCGRFLYHPS
jgi:predicted  nucleic acid-binding Zn-ribbon protein